MFETLLFHKIHSTPKESKGMQRRLMPMNDYGVMDQIAMEKSSAICTNFYASFRGRPI